MKRPLCHSVLFFGLFLTTATTLSAQTADPPKRPRPATTAGKQQAAKPGVTPNSSGIGTTTLSRAVASSLALIQKSAASFGRQAGGACFSCHHQSLPVFTMRLARDRGFSVDVQEAERQSAIVMRRFTLSSPSVLKALSGETKNASKSMGEHFPGGAAHIGYGIFGLAAWNKKPDSVTEAVARYLPRMQERDGRWRSHCSLRAPSEESDFTETALAVYALRYFITNQHTAEVAPALMRAKRWLITTEPKTTEDKTFRLFGLAWSGLERDSEEIRQAVEMLLADQRADGGWAQEAGMESDAYATGEALVALHQAGGLSVSNPAYQYALHFLLRNQEEDGSWFVRSRARPFQPYIHTGFPYGIDQFISMSASCWATAALALACPTQTVAARP
jgi:hypothetical protein